MGLSVRRSQDPWKKGCYGSHRSVQLEANGRGKNECSAPPVMRDGCVGVAQLASRPTASPTSSHSCDSSRPATWHACMHACHTMRTMWATAYPRLLVVVTHAATNTVLCGYSLRSLSAGRPETASCARGAYATLTLAVGRWPLAPDLVTKKNTELRHIRQ